MPMSSDSPHESLKKQLPSLQSRWLAWLRLHHRSLKSHHDEIVQATAVDLFQYLLERRDPVGVPDEINKIGFAILRRRTADQYRDWVRRWANESSVHLIQSTDPSSDPEKVAAYSRLLRAVLGMIAKLDRHSRQLLLRDESSLKPSALTVPERQRRSRLRARLRQNLLEAYGIDVKQLLGE